jgi:trigger factor
MAFNLAPLSNCKTKISFTFDNVNLDQQIDEAVKNKQKTVSIKGFRTGKAPLAMVKKLYGPQLENEALYRFIQKEFIAVIEQEQLRTVGYPAFENTTYDAEKKTLNFSVVVETFPEFELGELKKIKLKKEETIVEQNEIEALRKNYLDSKGEMKESPADTVLAKGQFAVINFQGELSNGDKPENMKGTEFLLEIGSNSFIPGFEDGLIGLKVGQHKHLHLTFPENYHQEDLKSAKVNFHVDLLEIKTKIIPDLTDDLAVELGYKSKEDFLTKTEATVKRQKEAQIKGKVQQELLEKLIEVNNFDLPASLVSEQEKYVKQDLKNNLKYQGFNDHMVEEYFDRWKEDLQKKAIFQVKSGLILNKFAEKFKIEANENELETKFVELADQSGMAVDDIKNYYGSNDQLKKNLLYSLKEQKTFDAIYAQVSWS